MFRRSLMVGIPHGRIVSYYAAHTTALKVISKAQTLQYNTKPGSIAGLFSSYYRRYRTPFSSRPMTSCTHCPLCAMLTFSWVNTFWQ